MYKNKTFLAIIPARGGSKRLPRKNIANLGNKPLIAWTIEAALNSKYIDTVLVTSDDDEILSVAEGCKAEILKRPECLATDTASSFDAIRHAIDNSKDYDYIVLLQPTSPLRNSDHVDAAIELLVSKNANAVISVCEMDHSPLWSNVLPDNGNMENFIGKDVIDKRSQDLSIYYRLNGAIYICRKDILLKEGTFFLKKNIFAFVMDRNSSIDIDEKIDFIIANCILNNSAEKKDKDE